MRPRRKRLGAQEALPLIKEKKVTSPGVPAGPKESIPRKELPEEKSEKKKRGVKVRSIPLHFPGGYEKSNLSLELSRSRKDRLSHVLSGIQFRTHRKENSET